MTYRDQARLNEILEDWTTNHEPEFDIVTDDGVGHIVWKIDDLQLVNEISNQFASIESLYIADGHHRTASAAKVALKRRTEFPNYTGEEEFNYFMSVIFPESTLNIMPYNRVVHDLNGLSIAQFIDKMSTIFTVEESAAPYKPMSNHNFGMYLDKKWYHLELKQGVIDKNNILEKIDAAVLEKHVLNDILGIKNLRASSRISFVGGIRGLKGVKEKTDELDGVGFAMHPVTMQEIMEVSDSGLIMPAKSTWFEPKLRSGLFVHKFDRLNKYWKKFVKKMGIKPSSFKQLQRFYTV